MLPPVRDSEIYNLAAWRLYRNNSPQPEIQNVATEFAGADAPKSRFLFTVAFEVDSGLGIDLGNVELEDNRYACKSATRPSQTIEYQDVNAYNYRFKVATKVDNGTATVVFYDDNKNTALNIIRNYMMTVSPVARRQSGPGYYNEEEDIQLWAGIGPLPHNSRAGIVKTLTVTHHYAATYRDNTQNHQSVHYNYVNPKLQNFVMEDLDMSTSEASMLTLTFVYDSVNIWYSDASTDTYTGGTVSLGNLETIEVIG